MVPLPALDVKGMSPCSTDTTSPICLTKAESGGRVRRVLERPRGSGGTDWTIRILWERITPRAIRSVSPAINLCRRAGRVVSKPVSRDVDAARNPHAISQPLQLIHEFLECPESTGTTDDPDVKTDIEHLRLAAPSLLEQHFDGALEILKIGARRPPRVIGDKLEIVAVEGIGNDQHGAARRREIVIRQIVGVFIRVVDETQFLEDSARIEARCRHRIEAKRALSGYPLDDVVGL